MVSQLVSFLHFFPTKTQHVFLYSFVRATRPAYLILLGLITRINFLSAAISEIVPIACLMFVFESQARIYTHTEQHVSKMILFNNIKISSMLHWKLNYSAMRGSTR